MIAGHAGKGTGAKRIHNGKVYDEGEMTVELRDAIAAKLEHKQFKVIKDDNNISLLNLLRLVKRSITKNDIVIDLHFNASSSPNASGACVFVPTAFSEFEKQFADECATTVAQALNIKNLGVRLESESYHGKIGILRVSCEAILIEVCFLSNYQDCYNYDLYKHVLVDRLSDLILKYAKA